MKMKPLMAGLLMMSTMPSMAALSAGALYGPTFSQCLSELSLIQPLSTSAHHERETALNQEVGKATKYLLMRDRLDVSVQETLDKLHQANLDRECRQVHNTLFTLLLKGSATPVSTARNGA